MQMQPDRDNALDMVKGFCVLAMVLHHAIEHFVESPSALRYVRFVSGAFPFLAGFVASHIYSVKYSEPGCNAAMGFRLVFRGLRLLTLCALLNVAINKLFVMPAHAGTQNLWGFLQNLLFTGDYRTVSFALLIPIGCVLVALGALQLGGLFKARVVVAVAAVVFVYCLAVHFQTDTGFYVCYFSYGLLGAATGFLPAQQLKNWCSYKTIASVVYVSSLAAITFLHQVVPIYAFSVVATLLMLYFIGSELPPAMWLSRELGIWGRYTLLLYLAQIIFMFAIAPFIRKLQIPSAEVILTCIITCIVQWALCLTLDKIRGMSKTVNLAYKLVIA